MNDVDVRRKKNCFSILKVALSFIINVNDKTSIRYLNAPFYAFRYLMCQGTSTR